MFGKHVEAAEATVVFIEMRGHTLYELILDVRTRDGHVVRTGIKERFVYPFLSPAVGDVVKVRYDPKSKAVKIDLKGDVRYDQHARDLARKAEHDALLAAPAGTPPPTLSYDAEVARFTLEAHQKLRNELLLSSSAGTATVLSIQEMGQAVPPLVGYVVEVEVRPNASGAPFTMEMDAWLDLSTHPIVPGSTVQVRYDPQNFFRIMLV